MIGVIPETLKAKWQEVYEETLSQTGNAMMAEQAAYGAIHKTRILGVVKSAFKNSDPDAPYIVAGWGMLFTDETDTDLDGEYFSAVTQKLLAYYEGAPLWYEHGVDADYGGNPIGKRVTATVYPRGVYVTHELHKDHPLFERTKSEIESGKLALSSDSIAHYVTQDNGVHNRTWPIAGWSLTGNPAEPALGAVSAKAFGYAIMNLQTTDDNGIGEARKAQADTNASRNFSILDDIQSGQFKMDENRLARIAEFLGTDSGAPDELAAGLRELADTIDIDAAAMEGDPEDMKMDGDPEDPDETKMDSETEESETLKSARQLFQSWGVDSFAGLTAKFRQIANDIEATPNRKPLNLKAGMAIGKSTVKPTPIIPSEDVTPTGAGRVPVKTTYYSQKPRRTTPETKSNIGRFFKELYAHHVHKTPMKSQSYQLGSSGGVLMNHAVSENFIESLRDKLILTALGADMLTMDGQETLTIPKDGSEPDAYWVGEGATIPESQETVGGITLYPLPLAVRIIVPNKFLTNSIVNYESRIQEKAEYRISRALELAAFFGAGGQVGSNVGKEPLGIATAATVAGRNVGLTTLGSGNGAKPKLSDIEDMIGRVEDANVEDDATQGFAMSNRAKRFFGNMKDGDGNYVLRARASESLDATFLGVGYETSNMFSNNQTIGTSTDATTIIYGMWSQLKIGLSNQMEFLVDPYSRASSLETVFIAHTYADVAIGHDEAFQVLNGARV